MQTYFSDDSGGSVVPSINIYLRISAGTDSAKIVFIHLRIERMKVRSVHKRHTLENVRIVARAAHPDADGGELDIMYTLKTLDTVRSRHLATLIRQLPLFIGSR